MYCICCDKDNVKPYQLGIDDQSSINEEEYIWSVEEKELNEDSKIYYGKEKLITNVDNRMWNDGIVQIIDAGYGSRYDTTKFVIAICDDCIKNKLQDGTLLNYGNYMSDRYSKDKVDKSKGILRRRQNLDRLV